MLSNTLLSCTWQFVLELQGDMFDFTFFRADSVAKTISGPIITLIINVCDHYVTENSENSP